MQLNAIKQKLTTRSTSFTHAASGFLDLQVCQDSLRSWAILQCSSFVGILVIVFWALAFSWAWELLGGCLPSPVPSPFFYHSLSVLWVPVFSFRVEAHGLVGDLPAMGGVSILELEANSGNSWCLRHPTSTLQLRQLLLLLLSWLSGYTSISKNVEGCNDECQLSKGGCTTEKKCGYWIFIGNNLPRCRLHTVATFDGKSYGLSLFVWIRRCLWKDSGMLYF